MKASWMTAVVAAAFLSTVGCGKKAEDAPADDKAKLEADAKKTQQKIADLKADADRKKDRIDDDTEKKVDAARENLAKEREQVRAEELDAGVSPKEVRAVEAASTGKADSKSAAADTSKDTASSEDKALRTVEGKLDKASDKKVKVTGDDGKELKLITDADTHFLQDGKKVDAADLKKGTPVKVSYILKGNDSVARKVEATGAPSK